MNSITTLLKATSWSLGTGLIVLNYYGLPILGGPLSYLAFSLVVVPAVVSITQGLVQEDERSRAFYWIILLSISLRLIAPLSEGQTAFMIENDSMYDFQVADIIAERGKLIPELATNRATQYVFFPALHILTVQISTVGGLPLYDVARFLPVLLTIVTIMILFKTYSWMMTPQMAIAASFLFSICYKYNWFDGSYRPESLGIIFFVMTFYAMMRTARGAEKSVFVIFISSIMLTTVTHFFTSLMLTIAVGCCYVFFRLMKRTDRSYLRIGIMDILVALVPLMTWLTYVAALYTLTVASYVAFYLQSLPEFFLNPFGRQGLVSAEGINATGIHLTGLTAFIVILGFLLTAAGGLIGVARAIHAIRRMASLQLKAAMVRAMIFCEIAFVFGVLAAAGIFTQANAVVLSDIPSRLIPFTYFFWSPAFGVGILFVARHMRRLRFGMNRSMIQRRTAMAYLCVGILLIMPAASSWLLMSTTIQGRVTLDDAEVMSLSNWLRTNGDKKVILMGDWITSKFVGALARQPIQEQNTLDGTLNGALYYGGNMTSRLLPLSRLNPPVYLLINEAYLSHKYYLITWIYEGRPAPSEKDMASSFTKINAFPMLDRVYSSPTLSLYVSAHA